MHTRFQTARLRATHSQGGQSTNTQPLRARTQRTELQSTKGEAPSFPSAAIHTTRTTTMYSMHSHCLFTDHWQAFHNNVQQTTRANATSHSSKLAEYHTTSTPPPRKCFVLETNIVSITSGVQLQLACRLQGCVA